MSDNRLIIKVDAPRTYDKLHEFHGEEIISTPIMNDSKDRITGWEHSGNLVENYDLNW